MPEVFLSWALYVSYTAKLLSVSLITAVVGSTTERWSTLIRAITVFSVFSVCVWNVCVRLVSSRIERSTDQVIKPVNLEALTRWVGHIPPDVLADMKSIAPMLSRLGYDPNANPPIYGKPDASVINNTDRVCRHRHKHTHRHAYIHAHTHTPHCHSEFQCQTKVKKSLK